MNVDLHVHLTPYSTCSLVSVDDVVPFALFRGLDGICVTDHGTYAGYHTLKRFAGDALSVFMGVEITTSHGDMLVYTCHEVPAELRERGVSPDSLLAHVSAMGGVCFAAHPFRESAPSLGLIIHELEGLAGLETSNGNCTDEQNERARTVATQLGLGSIGGSDAHVINQVGGYYTEFPLTLSDQRSFIEALARGDCRPAGVGDWVDKWK